MADALRRQEAAGRLRYIGIRHEGAASFACSAYGKLTGRPAACLAIAGPGATNLLTGLWDANVDRSPVLALTGQVNALAALLVPVAVFIGAWAGRRAWRPGRVFEVLFHLIALLGLFYSRCQGKLLGAGKKGGSAHLGEIHSHRVLNPSLRRGQFLY